MRLIRHQYESGSNHKQRVCHGDDPFMRAAHDRHFVGGSYQTSVSIIGFCDTAYFVSLLRDSEGGALQVFATAGMADKHFKFARFDDSVSFRIDDGAIGNRNIEGNGLALARF